MNILILSWRGPGHPLAGGAEQVTREHAKGWIIAGNKITMFTSRFEGGKPSETVDGIQIIRRGDQFFGVKLAACKWYWFENKEKFDLIIDEFHGLPFFTPLWAPNVKKIGFIHEVAQKVWSLNPWPWPFNKIAAILGKSGEPWIFKLLYTKVSFMTVSNSTAHDLKAWGIKKVTVIPNGVLLPKKLPKVKKDKDFTLIYLSALAKDKGVEDAIATFNIVKEKIPNAKFWIVGKSYPKYTNYLKSMCPEAKFWGYVTDENKFDLLSRAHLLIFPSVHEGWGLVIIEAASVGTPTIAYNVSGVRDAVVEGKTGLMANKETPEELYKLILELYKSKNLYLKLSKNAKEWSKNFSWEQSIKESTSLINKI
ncbi:MAG TPA: glycosyltransferase family 4 protein [Patescibacteria group bacterium]|nr:glycosyltransferase family 4 protein [Patescibacteria group bacterium]